MAKNCQLKREICSPLPIKTVLVEEEQHGECCQVLKTRRKEKYN